MPDIKQHSADIDVITEATENVPEKPGTPGMKKLSTSKHHHHHQETQQTLTRAHAELTEGNISDMRKTVNIQRKSTSSSPPSTGKRTRGITDYLACEKGGGRKKGKDI